MGKEQQQHIRLIEYQHINGETERQRDRVTEWQKEDRKIDRKIDR